MQSGLGLQDYLNKKAAELSRGWRQRLGIAQAIIHEPKLLLLDEPASGLDPEARQTLSELFLSLRDQGMTLLVSSHILAELEDYCTDMLLLREGKVVEYKASSTETHEEEKQQLVIQLTEDAQSHMSYVLTLTSLSNISFEKNIIRGTFSGDRGDKHALLKDLINNGIPVTDFSSQEKKLQDIYMDIARSGEKQNAH